MAISDEKTITFFILLGIASLLLLIGGIWFLLSGPMKLSACKNSVDYHRCVTDIAIQAKDAGICYYLDAGSDDLCLSEVITATDDPDTCKHIKLSGDRAYCLKKFNIE